MITGYCSQQVMMSCGLISYVHVLCNRSPMSLVGMEIAMQYDILEYLIATVSLPAL
jgi:hypothetical protein